MRRSDDEDGRHRPSHPLRRAAFRQILLQCRRGRDHLPDARPQAPDPLPDRGRVVGCPSGAAAARASAASRRRRERPSAFAATVPAASTAARRSRETRSGRWPAGENGRSLSTVPSADREGPAEIVAGFLAALAIVGGAIASVERPVPVGLVSIFIGFVAAAMADRNQRLAAAGVAAASLGFLVGMIVSVITSRPLW
jgi:hypothetical protein